MASTVVFNIGLKGGMIWVNKLSSAGAEILVNDSRLVLNSSYQLKLYQFFEEHGSVSIFSKNQLIWGGSDRQSTEIYYIKYGYVKAMVQDNLKEDSIYMIFGKGDIFSLHALLNQNTCDLQYVALNKVKVYSVSVALFQDNIANNSNIAHGVFAYILNNSVLYDSAVGSLHYSKVRERLISGLLALAIKFGRRQENCLILDKVFNHRLIAARINSSRESVSRELDKLRRKGLISTKEGCIVLKDINGLYAEINRPPAPEFQRSGLQNKYVAVDGFDQ